MFILGAQKSPTKQRREHKGDNKTQSPATPLPKMPGSGRGRGIGVPAAVCDRDRTQHTTPCPNTAHPTAAAGFVHPPPPTLGCTNKKAGEAPKMSDFWRCCPSWNTISLPMHTESCCRARTAGHRHPHRVFHGMEPAMQKHSQNSPWHKAKHCQTTVQRTTVQSKQQEIILIFFFKSSVGNCKIFKFRFPSLSLELHQKKELKSHIIFHILFTTELSQRHSVDGQVEYELFLVQYKKTLKKKLKIPITCI